SSPRPATAVQEPRRAVAAVVAPPPRISRTPAAVHSEDGRLAQEPLSGEDGHTPTIWPTRTTEREDHGPSSRESEDSRRLSSEIRSEQQPAETATQSDPTIATLPAPHESESSDSGSDHEIESESGSGD
ncbi:MAG TPA: hypothetical protein VNH40_08340, partial [Gaiellaceae bacterium]|nr:hypothetical protein [Gaiellaceae bacterium]